MKIIFPGVGILDWPICAVQKFVMWCVNGQLDVWSDYLVIGMTDDLGVY